MSDIDTNKQVQELAFSQKAIILAHTLYIGERFAQQEEYSQYRFKFMGKFYEWNQDREKYDIEFKKNNYYNLPEFKKLWEAGKEDGDGMGLPM